MLCLAMLSLSYAVLYVAILRYLVLLMTYGFY